MTKSTITRERLAKIKSWRETYGAGSNVMLPSEEAEELARIALAVMDGEPVALQPELAKVIYHFRDWNEGFPVERFKADYVISWMLANYPPAQPAKDREQVRSEHAEWSQATFGNVGPVGPLKHLAKEAMEAAVEPDDLSEWADMQFLLWDAQRRAGITDEQITQAMIDKLAVNKQREWPEPKDGEPRLHIKEQPAPVVPDFKKLARELVDNLVDCGGLDEGVKEKYLEWAEKTCRTTMLVSAPQSPGSEHATVPGKWIPVSERLPEAGGDMIVFTDGIVMSGVSYAKKKGFYIQALEYDDDEPVDSVTHWMSLPSAPQEVKGD
ncbi:TPA: dATP/dGTP pyrophosphohydrolase domain-containing protein [Klebsiella pneumoniae]